MTALSVVLTGSAAALWWGWRNRFELYVTPQSGLGYVLGITGTALMVLLLVYSLRKRVRFMRSLGPIRRWFATHMVLGILGPVAIFFHANFQLGSLNSRVALACMVIVAGSGLVGRFIYPKIHHGLFGSRASLRELKRNAEENRGAIAAVLGAPSPIGLTLKEFEAFALGARRGSAGSAWRLVALPIRASWVRRKCRRRLRSDNRASQGGEAIAAIEGYLDGIRRVAEFAAYERLFSLWHAFHLPICVMLFLAALVHVVAVHMY